MKETLPEPNDLLRSARRLLETQSGVKVLSELQWEAKSRSWAILVELSVSLENEARIPKTTRWYVLVNDRYPWGLIEIYPAKAGGITQTFHHQDRNSEGDKGLPWREGDICIRPRGYQLGRVSDDSDPHGSPDRLVWYAERAKQWIQAAADDTLVLPSENFELPQFGGVGHTVGFCEDAASFELWRRSACTYGVAEVVDIGNPFPKAVRRFLNPQGSPIVEPRWGRLIATAEDVRTAAWVRFPSLPVAPPYAAPVSWGELFEVMLDLGLRPELLREALRPLRDNQHHLLLVGFPIPRRFGENSALMHWQPLLVPLLASEKNSWPGFRRTEEGFWKQDLQFAFKPAKPLSWLTGRNWAKEELATRGSFSPALCDKKICLIGAGSLGSAIAELLVRGGVHTLSIIDWDSLNAGNLRRHTLSLRDVGYAKASRLADRLNSLSPHVNVEAVDASVFDLPTDRRHVLDDADLVIDCSGSDDVIQALAEHRRKKETDFCSISMGRGAKRLYVFMATGLSFPAHEFETSLEAPLELDRTEFKELHFVWEGIGCWHPVFPANTAQIWSFSTKAVAALDAAARGAGTAGLLVIEDQERMPAEAGEATSQ